ISMEVKKELHKEQNLLRVKHYQEATVAVAKMKNLSKRERNRKRADMAAVALAYAVKECDMFGVFRNARDRMRRAMALHAKCEAKLREVEKAVEEGLTDERLRAELEQLERLQDEEDAAYEYETFRGREDQPAMLRALDYDDRAGVTKHGEERINLFYVCKRKLDACTTWGLYMAGKFWRKAGRKWKCGIDGDEWEKHTGTSRTLVEDLGCGATYRPWACGEGMVMEFYSGMKWWAILADLMPEILDDEI
ncbi:MAG: hypothetical protein GY772_22100, partial [bacterium]|nr:hypothetical protein [bacterium]